MEWLAGIGSALSGIFSAINTHQVNKTNKEIAEENIQSQKESNLWNFIISELTNKSNQKIQESTNKANKEINRQTNEANMQMTREANEANIQMQNDANETNLEIVRQTNQANLDIANQNLQFQKDSLDYNKLLNQQIMEREDNAVQRHVADLRAAGLSPLYDMNGAGAGGTVTPIGSMENTAQMQAGSVEAPTMQAAKAEAMAMGMTPKEYAKYQAVQNQYQMQMTNFDAIKNIGTEYVNATHEAQRIENEKEENRIKKEEVKTKKLQVINSHNEEMLKITTMQKKAEQEITNMIQQNETEKKKLESMDIDNKEKESRINKIEQEIKTLETQREATRAGIIKTMGEITNINKENYWKDKREANEAENHYYTVKGMKQQIAQTEIETEVKNIMLKEIQTKGSYNQQSIEMTKKQLTEKYWELGADFINDAWNNAWNTYRTVQDVKDKKKRFTFDQTKWNFWKAFKKW